MEAIEICRCTVPDMTSISGDIFCVGCGCPLLDREKQKAQSEAAKHFMHKPLANPTDFRLIRLLPGMYRQPVFCEILRFSIEDHPPYEAISYTWGNQEDKVNIFTQAGLFPVTSNCANALLDLRDTARDRLLWIDVVCINQEDNMEKNHQVPLIRSIYSEAERVFVHLGSDCSPVLQKFLDALREGKKMNSIKFQAIATDVLSWSWFSRVWVLQEVAAAREAFVVVGSQKLSWKMFTPGRLHALGLKAIDKAGRTPSVLLQKDERPFKDIPSLLHAARNCASTRPHDRIYALLGLLEHPDDLKLIPDYNKPVGTFFTEVTAQIISNYNHLDVLTEVGTGFGATDDLKAAAVTFKELRNDFLKVFGSLTTTTSRYNKGEVAQLQSRIEYFENAPQRAGNATFDYEVVACNHWKKMKRLIPKIASTMLHIDTVDYSEPFERMIYRCFGVSAEAEKRVLGQEILHQSFKRLQRFSPGCSPNFLNLTLSEDTRNLIRTAHYLFFILETMAESLHKSATFFGDKANDFSELLASKPIAIPSWVPNYARSPFQRSRSRWRPKLQGSLISSGEGPACVEVLGDSLRVKTLKLDCIQLDHQMNKLPDYELEEHAQRNADVASEFYQGRHITKTRRSFAISPMLTGGWDIVCIIDGASVPMVLKPMDEEEEKYYLVGECYLHGCEGPEAAGDYLQLIGEYRQYFSAATADELPWETLYLV